MIDEKKSRGQENNMAAFEHVFPHIKSLNNTFSLFFADFPDTFPSPFDQGVIRLQYCVIFYLKTI